MITAKRLNEIRTTQAWGVSELCQEIDRLNSRMERMQTQIDEQMTRATKRHQEIFALEKELKNFRDAASDGGEG